MTTDAINVELSLIDEADFSPNIEAFERFGSDGLIVLVPSDITDELYKWMDEIGDDDLLDFDD